MLISKTTIVSCCGRQFVAGGQDWFVSDADKLQIDCLLLERISLCGICRVMK
jgi:hypothetical protein